MSQTFALAIFVGVILLIVVVSVTEHMPQQLLVTPASEVITCEPHENPCNKIDCDRINTGELT